MRVIRFCSDWLCVVVFSPLSVSLESVPSPPHTLALGTLPTAQHNHHIRLHTYLNARPTQVLHECSVHTTVPLGLEETECEWLESRMGLQELSSGKCPLCQPAKNHTNRKQTFTGQIVSTTTNPSANILSWFLAQNNCIQSDSAPSVSHRSVRINVA